MKTIKIILKGILLYTTIIAVIVFIGSIESLYDKGYIIPATAIIVALIYICYKNITEQEIDILSLNKWTKFNNDKY